MKITARPWQFAIVVLIIASSEALSGTCSISYDDYLLRTKPCGMGWGPCDDTNAHPNREKFFEEVCVHITNKADASSILHKKQMMTPVADWSAASVANLDGSSVQYTGNRVRFDPVEPELSSFEVDDKYLHLSFDPLRQNDDDAKVCVSPSNESEVCNDSWAYAVKALMDSAYNKATHDDRRFSFDFIRHCLYDDLELQCSQRKPEEILEDISTGNVLIPFEDDFDYEGVDSCESYSRSLGYGGEFVVEKPDQPNRGGLMNLVKNYPTMVLVGLSLRSVQVGGGLGVRFSDEDTKSPNVSAGDDPNIYGVMSGYHTFDPQSNNPDGVGMWFVESRLMSCFHAFLNLPMSDSEDDGNYAGISAYAVGLSFVINRNAKVDDQHLYWENYDPIKYSLKFDANFCESGPIRSRLFSSFNYLNEFVSHSSCKYTDDRGKVYDFPPPNLRTQKMIGGCYVYNNVLTCGHNEHATELQMDLSMVDVDASLLNGIYIKRMPRLRRLTLGDDEKSLEGFLENMVDLHFEDEFKVDVSRQITSLSILGNVFSGWTSLDFGLFTNLQKVIIAGKGIMSELQSLEMENLKRLETVIIRGEGACNQVGSINVKSSFRAGYFTSLSILNGAMNGMEDTTWEADLDTHLFRLVIAGYAGDQNAPVYSFGRLQSLVLEGFANLYGIYYAPADTNATPDTKYGKRFTASFVGEIGGLVGELVQVDISNGKYRNVEVNDALPKVRLFTAEGLEYLQKVSIEGAGSLSELRDVSFFGSFDRGFMGSKCSVTRGALDNTKNVIFYSGYAQELFVTESGAQLESLTIMSMPLLKTITFFIMDSPAECLLLRSLPLLETLTVHGDGSFPNLTEIQLDESITLTDADTTALVMRTLTPGDQTSFSSLERICVYPYTTSRGDLFHDAIIGYKSDHGVIVADIGSCTWRTKVTPDDIYITTIVASAIHDMSFQGTTISERMNEVKLIPLTGARCDDNTYGPLTVVQVSENEVMVADVSFTEKIPGYSVCHKFYKDGFRMLTTKVTLMYISSVMPTYTVESKTFSLYLEGNDLSGSSITVSADASCSPLKYGPFPLQQVDSSTTFSFDVMVDSYYDLLYLCMNYLHGDGNTHVTGYSISVYGVQWLSVDKWLKGVTLPSQDTVNTDGLIVRGNGLDLSTLKFVLEDGNCDTDAGVPIVITELTGSTGPEKEYVADPITFNTVGIYKICTKFPQANTFMEYSGISIEITEYASRLGSETSLNLILSDTTSELTRTVIGDVDYFTDMDVKVIPFTAADCSATAVSDITMSIASGTHDVTFSSTSGQNDIYSVCIGHSDLPNWYRVLLPLYVKELVSVSSGTQVNTLVLMEGQTTITLSGFQIGSGDQIKFVGESESCTDASDLLYDVPSSKTVVLDIQSTLTSEKFKACYKFNGETAFVSYSAITLTVHTVSEFTPQNVVVRLPADDGYDFSITGLGRSVGDLVWFVAEGASCKDDATYNADITRSDEVVVNDLTAPITIKITNVVLQTMCYKFSGHSVMTVTSSILYVFSVESMNHSSWIVDVALPTTGFQAPTDGGSDPIVLTGYKLSENLRVKFVKSSTSCNAAGDTVVGPVLVSSVTTPTSTGEMSATLPSVTFEESGDYYLCAGDSDAATFFHYANLKIIAHDLQIDGIVSSYVLLSGDPATGTGEVLIAKDNNRFLEFASPSAIEIVWAETSCDSPSTATATFSEKDSTHYAVETVFEGTALQLDMCVKLPNDVYIGTNYRVFFKIINSITIGVPFISDTQTSVSAVVAGQNLSPNDYIIMRPKTATDLSEDITEAYSTGPISFDLGASPSTVYIFILQFTEQTAQIFLPVEIPDTNIYKMTSFSPMRLVHGQVQTITVGFEGNLMLPDETELKLVTEREPCSFDYHIVFVTLDTNNQGTASLPDKEHFTDERRICIRLKDGVYFRNEIEGLLYNSIHTFDDPIILLRDVATTEVVLNLSYSKDMADQFKFVPDTSTTCDTNDPEIEYDIGFSFTVENSFQDYKLCYNFKDSAGYFMFDRVRAYSIPASTTISASEYTLLLTKAANAETVGAFYTRAKANGFVDAGDDTVLPGAAVTAMTTDLFTSEKVLSAIAFLEIKIAPLAHSVINSIPAGDPKKIEYFVQALRTVVLGLATGHASLGGATPLQIREGLIVAFPAVANVITFAWSL